MVVVVAVVAPAGGGLMLEPEIACMPLYCTIAVWMQFILA